MINEYYTSSKLKWQLQKVRLAQIGVYPQVNTALKSLLFPHL